MYIYPRQKRNPKNSFTFWQKVRHASVTAVAQHDGITVAIFQEIAAEQFSLKKKNKKRNEWNYFNGITISLHRKKKE